MRADASPEMHRAYIERLARGDIAEDGLQKLTDDPRVTRLGRFLRRTSLDELPQLINVVRGHMSLVGPRPAIEYELAFYGPQHHERFSVRPGLTGLWQVKGRSELGFREMLDLDVEYASHCGLKTDAEILLRTPRAVLSRRAA
jgi:lipopolysaccharide/colanic/teichoic acid biosynthesis glycosyltransferase